MDPKKFKNPLYIVKGKDVEEAKNYWDLLLKKFNLEPFMQLLNQVIALLSKQFPPSTVLALTKKILDQWLEKLNQLMTTFKAMNGAKA